MDDTIDLRLNNKQRWNDLKRSIFPKNYEWSWSYKKHLSEKYQDIIDYIIFMKYGKGYPIGTIDWSVANDQEKENLRKSLESILHLNNIYGLRISDKWPAKDGDFISHEISPTIFKKSILINKVYKMRPNANSVDSASYRESIDDQEDSYETSVYKQISLLNDEINRMSLGELKNKCKSLRLNCYGKRDPLKRRLKKHFKVEKLIEAGLMEPMETKNDFTEPSEVPAKAEEFPHLTKSEFCKYVQEKAISDPEYECKIIIKNSKKDDMNVEMT